MTSEDRKFNGIIFDEIGECIQTKKEANEYSKKLKNNSFQFTKLLTRVIKKKCGYSVYTFDTKELKKTKS